MNKLYIVSVLFLLVFAQSGLALCASIICLDWPNLDFLVSGNQCTVDADCIAAPAGKDASCVLGGCSDGFCYYANKPSDTYCGIPFNSCDGSGHCVFTPVDLCTGVNCDDSNACTDDTCNPLIGCVHITKACDDSNACTTDSCNSVTGCAHTAINCDDGNPNTADTCDTASGCQHFSNFDICTVLSCNDFNVCTTDSCIPYQGCAHYNITCNDNNALTTDSCNAITGCVHTPLVDVCDSLDCNDSNACTADSCTPYQGCAHSAIVCNDENPFTIDSCDPASGCVYAPDTEKICMQDPVYVMGKVYMDNNLSRPVAGASVSVDCRGNILTKTTKADGSYSVRYGNEDSCECALGDNATVTAAKGSASGSNEGIVNDWDPIYVAIVNVSIPEFGVIAAAVAMIGAIGGIVMFRRH